MEPSTGREGSLSSRRPSSPASRPAAAAKAHKVSITPFHCSPIIISSNAPFRGKRPPGPGRGKRLSAPAGLFLSTAGRLATPLIRERLAAAPSGSADGLTLSSRAGRTPAEEETPEAPPVRPAGTKALRAAPVGPQESDGPRAEPQPHHNKKEASQKPPGAARGRKKKRKMGMYNLVPKKKVKTVKQHNKKEGKKSRAAAEHKPEAPPEDRERPAARNRTLKQEKEDEQAGPGGPVEYTELALDCLDLKAQVELLSPPLSGVAADAEVTESDLAEELPLCCCRMETPCGGGHVDQICMAMETADGTLSRCQRRAMKQEMMRPSNTVHLLVLCEDHRAGMVKHQCCPGCGLFCRAGSFLECRPYGNISHRFHWDCASILKERRFCPHCGEDATRAAQVTVPRSEPSPSVPRSNPGPSLPTAATLPSVPATPAVPQTLRAKKSSEPQRDRDDSPDRLKDEAPRPAERLPKESLENILTALDDENLKPKTVKYPARQLYVSAKQGDLQKVIHLLVNGRDPNFLMDSQNKRTPLHAAAAEGHHEVCHMLVQAGANLDMFDKEQRTPLMSACENNHLDTVKYLIRAGAAVGHKDVLGFSCLHLAAKLGHYNVIQHLLSKASKHINCQDDGGWTPITWAIEYKHAEVVLLLLGKGADVNIRDKEENVCLHWAALSGCDDIAQALLDARCDLNAINVHGDSPLHIAARENHLECVVLFLSRGADASLRNVEGQTALDCCLNGSKVWAALNANKKLTDARRGRDCLEERVLSRDVSRGYESVPISCVNGVDGEPCPDNFKYIPDSCVTSPLNIDKDITRLQHCSCTDDCVSGSCVCGQLSLRCWYDSEGRLPQDFCQREPPVLFECNHACSCWRSCRNRVVQNGLRVRLQLFRTLNMGWGVKAMQDVPQGTFVCEYVGEIISDAEADKRENDSFLFTLDNKVGDVHCIDARLFGNIGRFINHLCEPNLLAVRVFTMHQDLRFPRIAFFSSRNIKAGEHIGFDYGDHYWRVKRKYFSCQCGSPKCRHSAGGQ